MSILTPDEIESIKEECSISDWVREGARAQLAKAHRDRPKLRKALEEIPVSGIHGFNSKGIRALHPDEIDEIIALFDEEGIRKAERERIINWMNEVCPHTGGLEEQHIYKQDCPKCWVALKNNE